MNAPHPTEVNTSSNCLIMQAVLYIWNEYAERGKTYNRHTIQCIINDCSHYARLVEEHHGVPHRETMERMELIIDKLITHHGGPVVTIP